MTSARCATRWPAVSSRHKRGTAVLRLPARATGRVRSMDRALLVKNAVSTVKTIKTLRGPGGALDCQRRRRPGQLTFPDLAGRLPAGPPPQPARAPGIAEKWRPCAAWRPATCSPPPSNPPRYHRSPGTGALNMNDGCTHLDRIRDVIRSSRGCEDCLAQGRQDWVHLRVRQERGHAGCCDNSPGRPATAHFRLAGHPGYPVLRNGRGLASVLPRPVRIRTPGCPRAPSPT
jgi:hypothetical protein